jgi:hypothetical protein
VREGVRAVDDRDDAARAAASQIGRTGKMWPVRFVMWLTCSTFVRGVIARVNRSTKSCWLSGGTGNEIFVSVIPSRFTRCS